MVQFSRRVYFRGRPVRGAERPISLDFSRLIVLCMVAGERPN